MQMIRIQVGLKKFEDVTAPGSSFKSPIRPRFLIFRAQIIQDSSFILFVLRATLYQKRNAPKWVQERLAAGDKRLIGDLHSVLSKYYRDHKRDQYIRLHIPGA